MARRSGFRMNYKYDMVGNVTDGWLLFIQIYNQDYDNNNIKIPYVFRIRQRGDTLLAGNPSS